MIDVRKGGVGEEAKKVDGPPLPTATDPTLCLHHHQDDKKKLLLLVCGGLCGVVRGEARQRRRKALGGARLLKAMALGSRGCWETMGRSEQREQDGQALACGLVCLVQ